MQYKQHTFTTNICSLLLFTTFSSNIYTMQKEQEQFCMLMHNITSYADIHRIVTQFLFGSEKQTDAIDKFISMPIGKALEWYTFTKKLSRGKSIYRTPLFSEIFQKNNLEFTTNHTQSKVFTQKNEWEVYLDTFTFHSNKLCYVINNRIDRIHLQSPNNKTSLEQNKRELFLDILAIKFFMFSEQEMSSFIKLMIMLQQNSSKHIEPNDIQDLCSISEKTMIDKKWFLNWEKHFPYKHFDFSIKDPITFNLIVLGLPFLLIAMSTFIKSTISPAINIKKENYLRNIVNKAIMQLHDDRLTKYLYPILEGGETSSWNYTLKINSPFLIPQLFFIYRSYEITAGCPTDFFHCYLLSCIPSGICSFLLSYITYLMPMDNFGQFFIYAKYCTMLIVCNVILWNCYKFCLKDNVNSKRNSLSNIIKHKLFLNGTWLL